MPSDSGFKRFQWGGHYYLSAYKMIENILRTEILILITFNDLYYWIYTLEHTWTTHFNTTFFSTTCCYPECHISSTVTNPVIVFNVSLKHTISPTFAKSWTNWIKSHHYLHSSLSLHFSDKRVYCRSLIAAVTAQWVKKTRLINHPPVPRQRILNSGWVQIVPRATTSDPDPPPFPLPAREHGGGL